jgi:hypothetical protein
MSFDPSILNNPIALMQLLGSKEGRAAAAIQLAQAGLEPEEFETAIVKNAEQEAEPVAPVAPVTAPVAPAQGGDPMSGFGSLFASNPGGSPYLNPNNTPTAPNAGLNGMGGGTGMNINPQALFQALQGVKAIAPTPQQLLQPAGVAPRAGNPGALNAGSVEELVRLAMMGQFGQQGAPGLVPSIGAMIKGGM